MAMIYDDSSVKARPHNNVARAYRVDRVYAFWVVLEGGAWTLPFTVSLPDGTEAIALFSGEEEAKMFRHFSKEGANSSILETTAGEVLSLLYGPWSVAGYLALDPFPEVLSSRLSGPLTLSRERFARSFAGADFELVTRSPLR
jgi:hypothetical protein